MSREIPLSRRQRDAWTTLLNALLESYRANKPEDKRPTSEIFNTLMDQFVEMGTVRKNEDGTYTVSELIVCDFR